MRWAEQQRLQFITERLRMSGSLTRADLKAEFGISTPQASIDIRKFKKKNPRAMKYDLSKKCYVATTLSKDRGSVFLTREKDGKTVTVRARSPGSMHESKVSVPADIWSKMVTL